MGIVARSAKYEAPSPENAARIFILPKGNKSDHFSGRVLVANKGVILKRSRRGIRMLLPEENLRSENILFPNLFCLHVGRGQGRQVSKQRFTSCLLMYEPWGQKGIVLLELSDEGLGI
jgi:hypothetical protein